MLFWLGCCSRWRKAQAMRWLRDEAVLDFEARLELGLGLGQVLTVGWGGAARVFC